MVWCASFKRNLSSVFVRPCNNIAYIDGLRALSCLGIMLYHCFFLLHLFVPEDTFTLFVEQTPLLLSWIWGLDKSVDVFFVSVVSSSGACCSANTFKRNGWI